MAQPTPGSLTLEVKHGDSSYIATFTEGQCRGTAVTAPERVVVTGEPAKRRKTGGRKRKELTPEEQHIYGLTPLSTKKEVLAARRRNEREAKAIDRGQPIKSKSARRNIRWDPVQKQQAISVVEEKFGQ